MAKIRRIIQKIVTVRETGFEQQFWPIVIALCILGGFVYGASLALLNGFWLWLSLIAVPIVVCMVIAVLHMIDNRILRRSIQLAMILSLIFHVGLLILLNFTSIFGASLQPGNVSSRTERQPIRIRQETNVDVQQYREVTREPIPAEEIEQVEQQRQKSITDRQQQPTPVPKPQTMPQATLNQRSEKSESIPRREQTLSRLSRRQSDVQPKSGTAAESSETPSTETMLQASKTNVTKQGRANTPSTPVLEAPQNSSQTAQSQIVRKRNPTQTDVPADSAKQARNDRMQRSKALASVTGPSTNAKIKSPQQEPKPEKSSPSDSNTAQADQAKPAETSVTQQPTTHSITATTQPPQLAHADLKKNRRPDRVLTSRPNRTQQPSVAKSPASIPIRSDSRQPIAPNSETKTDTETAKSIVESETIQPSPASSQISRSNRPTKSNDLNRNPNAQPEPIPVATTAMKSARRKESQSPSVSSDSPASARRRKSTELVADSTSPTRVENPSRAKADAADGSGDPQPVALEIARRETGAAGKGSSANLMKDTPTTARPSLIASNSRSRPQPTRDRNTPADNAMAASSRSRNPRTMAEQPLPSDSMVANSESDADRSGTRNPTTLTANSSPATVDSASQADASNVSADVGSANMDLGPQKIVSESGNGRASGGGQPVPDTPQPAQPIRRSRTGGGSQPSLLADIETDDTSSPKSDGGSQPANSNSDLDAISLVEVQRDGNRPDSAGPSGGMIAGPTTDTSSATKASESIVSRTEPSESMPGEQSSGGGTPNHDADRRLIRAQLAGGPDTSSIAIVDNVIQQPPRSDKNGLTQIADLAGIDTPSIKTVSADRGKDILEKLDGASKGPSREGDAEYVADQAGGGGSEATSIAELPVASHQSGGKRQSSEDRLASSTGPASSGTIQRNEVRGDFAANTNVDTSEIEIPIGETGDGSVASGRMNELADIGLVRQEANSGEEIIVDADPGPGGAGSIDAAENGLNSRRAREHGPLQAYSESRFFREDAGGIPTFNKIVVYAREAFDARGKPSQQSPGEPTTEVSIEMGLAYLTTVQQENGRWILEHKDDEPVTMHSDTAATGLALLAFQGAGYNHREYKYAEQLSAAVNWLINHQHRNGSLYLPTDEDSNAVCELYSHGIAALALCEAYGMTQDPMLKGPAQRALNFIAASQDKELGGWRYAPGRGADTSVTGWMMMALKSGRLAGLKTDNDTIRKTETWLDSANTSNEPYLYRYNPYAEDEGRIKRRHGRNPTQCMTAVGLLMRLYSGSNRDHIDVLRGADYLLTKLPDDTSSSQRDTYYWYYATQVLRHVGGRRWKIWNDSLHPLLVDSQIAEGQFAGSWDPFGPVPDRWGPHGGRLYVTAMNLLSLEVDYRLLPLYEDTVE